MDEQTRRTGVPRRTVLSALGVAGVTAAGLGLALNGSAPLGEALRLAVGIAGPKPAGKRAVVRVERVHSAARGQDVDLLTILPPGATPKNLPMSILLHGLHGNARYAAVGGMVEVFTSAVVRGAVPPFGFVAVDGGDNYWHENIPGDDPMAMLLEEVPRWLAERGLGGADGLPFACTGVSMGGFGALLYARRRAERRRPLQAVATIAPGLLTSWPEMAKRKAFANADQWASLDPLKHLPELGDTPVGVWIGDQDRFIVGTRQFIKAKHPAVGSIGPGGHDDRFFRRAVPDVIRFVGKRVPKSGA
ncbi:alpha/beta hydrolase-fold protein [Umezawaea sp. Da 62-37]|uniref:alpha/beta hydrolase n=1 Tax=Umezawaea sp. Da 62-37 TaxID=3075927 RepID=UPI0028F6E809|nr:alpha/beta hydrolase-fold protein [Umezawaea sp. Da 62-37]WNV83266.1 alpha/beta hydrolase-fold protein [Umezawaea sp. Da 62-37]